MKLRLTQPGFETYTAQMGVIFFVDGLSVTDVLLQDATRMAAVMGCEWEDGSPANVGQIYLDNMKTPAESFTYMTDSTIPSEPEQEVVSGVIYTEDALAAVADSEGIAGVRVIADMLGIKGNSIRGLIDAILKANPPVAA